MPSPKAKPRRAASTTRGLKSADAQAAIADVDREVEEMLAQIDRNIESAQQRLARLSASRA